MTVHFSDALELDFAALDPAPTAVVANLPYGIAATVILRTIDELPSVGSWVVMVQREVGERLAAAPGSAAYGAPSVLAQLACEVKVLRPVARTVFRPVPRVDSVLVGLRRRPGSDEVDPAVRGLVHDAFAHRRKALAGSLALAPGAPPGVRERARSALVDMGHPPDERAERLSPVGVPGARGEAGGSVRLVAKAPGKVNLSLFVGGRRPDGRHELVTLIESVSLADELELVTRVALDDEVVCPGVEEPNIVVSGLGWAAGARLGRAAGPGDDPQADPDRGRHGRRVGRRGGRAADGGAACADRRGRARRARGRARIRRAEPARARAGRSAPARGTRSSSGRRSPSTRS